MGGFSLGWDYEPKKNERRFRKCWNLLRKSVKELAGCLGPRDSGFGV